MFNRILLSATALTLAIFASSCKKDDDNSEPLGDGRIQFVHAAPNSPAVDIYVAGTRVIDNQGYGVSSGYKTQQEGSKTVVVNETAKISPVLTQVNASIAKNANYSLYVVRNAGDNGFDNILTTDTLTATSPGKAYVRFINAIPSTGTDGYTITKTSGTDQIPFPNVRQVLPYKNFTPFRTIDAGSIDIALTNASASAIETSRKNFSFAENKYYTILASGTTSTTDTSAIRIIISENAR